MIRKCGVCGEYEGKLQYGEETETIHCRCTRKAQAVTVVLVLIALLGLALYLAIFTAPVSPESTTLPKQLYREAKYRAYRDLRTDEERVLWQVTGDMR